MGVVDAPVEGFEASPVGDPKDDVPGMMRGSYSTEQMIALHGFLAEGLAVAEPALAEVTGSEMTLEVSEVRCGPLEEFAERGLRLGDDVAAAVLARLEGGLTGSLALALEPDDALLWAQTADRPDPVAAYLDFARAVEEGIAGALSGVLRERVACVAPRLVETTEPCLLATTHAPPDTVVVSARLRIEARDFVLSAAAHLLITPKHFTRLLTALSAALH